VPGMQWFTFDFACAEPGSDLDLSGARKRRLPSESAPENRGLCDKVAELKKGRPWHAAPMNYGAAQPVRQPVDCSFSGREPLCPRTPPHHHDPADTLERLRCCRIQPC